MKEAHRTRRWWPASAGLAFVGIAVLSLGPDVTPPSRIMDRLSHAAAYTALMAIALMALDDRGPRRWTSALMLAFGLVTFGAAMELAQALVHRDASVADGVSDVVGVAMGLAAHSIMRIIKGRRRRSMASQISSQLWGRSAPGRTGS